MLKKTLSTTFIAFSTIIMTACSTTPNPTATIETTMGDFQVELYANEVPEMAKNFIELAKAGRYDDVPFHRIVPGFVIQGGDFTAKNGTGGHSYLGPGTVLDGEFDETVSSNTRGTLSYANRGPDTNGSQFFINLQDNLPLDHDKEPLTSQHPVFAKVISGMEVVDNIASVETDNERPVEDVLIESVTVNEANEE